MGPNTPLTATGDDCLCVDSDIGIVVDILEVDAGAGGRGKGCLQVQLVLLHAARVEDWVGVHCRDLGGRRCARGRTSTTRRR